MYLKNYTEYLVEDSINELIHNYDDICKCQKCMYDMMALALNNLPAQYVVSEDNEIYRKVISSIPQNKADVLRACVDAINIVSNNPRNCINKESIHIK
ncbi:MAG: late competence development ComFB family protein [Firmicutes bacterium]|jgi:competence protein ComFB|nr:late competence development ComFB family protein [Bacillota bacterium]